VKLAKDYTNEETNKLLQENFVRTSVSYMHGDVLTVKILMFFDGRDFHKYYEVYEEWFSEFNKVCLNSSS